MAQNKTPSQKQGKEAQQSNAIPKQNRNLSGQIPNPVTPCLISKGFDASTLSAL